MANDNTDQSASAVPPPDPELRRLDPLVGTWRAEDHTEDSVLGPGVPVRSVESFSWFDGGYFLVQTYETLFGDEPAQKGVNYWMYNPRTKEFRIIFFSNNGPYDDAGSQYAGGVAGDKLTMVGPARFEYDLDNEGRIKLNADGTLSVVWWLRDEEGKWKPWMNNTFSRTDAGRK